MDAAQYASYLQGLGRQDENKQLREETIRRYRPIREKQVGQQLLQAASWIENGDAQTRYIKEFIFDPIVKLLPPAEQDLLRAVPVLVLPNRTVNGCVARAPNGEPLIIIDSGLMSMVSFWFERFFEAAWMAFQRPLTEVASFNLTTYKFIIDYYKTRGIFAFPMPASEGNLERIQGPAMVMTMGTEIFILLHEMVHILHGHLESSPVGRFKMFPSEDTIIDIFQHPWAVEYEADGIAYLVYQKLWSSHQTFSKLAGSSNPLLPREAPLHFFQYLALIERNVPSSEAVPTHPPALNRVKFLQSLIEQAGDLEVANRASFLVGTIADMPQVT
jgi:hypothetical protein